MFDPRRAAANTALDIEDRWHRMPATQRLVLRGLGLLVGVVLVGAIVGGWASSATASSDATTYTGTAVLTEFQRLRASLDDASGELELMRLKLDRAEALLKYSSRYRIPADLAGLIYDTALREGIDPELGFRLVNIESQFNVRAKSHAAAHGLTQLQVATARFYEAGVTVEQLYEPERNLRIGFRYLRDLIETYGDVRLALLVYNRGPVRVRTLLEEGRDPDNGYPSTLMDGYPGS